MWKHTNYPPPTPTYVEAYTLPSTDPQIYGTTLCFITTVLEIHYYITKSRDIMIDSTSKSNTDVIINTTKVLFPQA